MSEGDTISPLIIRVQISFCPFLGLRCTKTNDTAENEVHVTDDFDLAITYEKNIGSVWRMRGLQP